MKAWELSSIVVSIARDMAVLLTVATRTAAWAEVADLFANFGQLVARQDRARLDAELPEDYVLAVLETMSFNLYRSQDGVLRSRPVAAGDAVISLIDAYQRYGGGMLEEVFEYGSVKVDADSGPATQGTA